MAIRRVETQFHKFFGMIFVFLDISQYSLTEYSISILHNPKLLNAESVQIVLGRIPPECS